MKQKLSATERLKWTLGILVIALAAYNIVSLRHEVQQLRLQNEDRASQLQQWKNEKKSTTASSSTSTEVDRSNTSLLQNRILQRTRALSFNPNPADDRPPFDTVVDNVTRQLIRSTAQQQLLDFAIIGFGKCGTTSLASWLEQQVDLQIYPQEVYSFTTSNLYDLVTKLYELPVVNSTTTTSSKAKKKVWRGLKSPNDLRFPHTLDLIRTYFPTTKLLVGIRNPVPWFFSLYNFRVQNAPPRKHASILPITELHGERGARLWPAVCTRKGEFGLYLRHLGQSQAFYNNGWNASTQRYRLTDQEVEWYQQAGLYRPVGGRKPLFEEFAMSVPNPIFLFETSQLTDATSSDPATQARWNQFRKDVQSFLGLPHAMPSILPHERPGLVWKDPDVIKKKASLKVDKADLCKSSQKGNKEDFAPLRQALHSMAIRSSRYILEYLVHDEALTQNNTTISSPQHFRHLIRQWQDDPCP